MRRPAPSPAVAAVLGGALWIIGSMFCFTVMWLAVRFASRELDALQILFFRFFFGFLFLVPILLRSGGVNLGTRRLGLHFLNGLFQVMATACTFVGLSLIQIAEVTALTFTAPLFVTAGAALFLGETVRRRRWTATAVGFLGALIILRPGVQAISPPALVVLAGSAFIAGGILSTKSLSRTEAPDTIALYLTVLMTVMSLPVALTVWTAPSMAILGWLALTGLSGSLGLMAMARAYRAADASLVMPFRYVSLLFAAAFGYLLFDERPDLWTWVGAAVIISAALYTARREVRLTRQARQRQAR
jgi:drug/metabolite transporter (DMT)-like permease